MLLCDSTAILLKDETLQIKQVLAVKCGVSPPILTSNTISGSPNCQYQEYERIHKWDVGICFFQWFFFFPFILCSL